MSQERVRQAALWAGLCLVGGLAHPVASQQPAPVGGEFQVNTFTPSYQRYPSVSVDADGGFVVVWESDGSSGSDSSYRSVQGQRYASDGTPLGSEIQVNTFTTNDQRRPSVSLDADGDFVVVWQSDGSSGTDSSLDSVQGQRYASDGTPLGSQFQVNTFTTLYQRDPSVSLDADGDFVVVWASYGSSGTDSSGFSVQGQRYASDGTPLGSQFQVNTYTTYFQRDPSVSVDTEGDFVVVWPSDGSSGSDSSARSVQGQRYASDGTPLGNEFQVNTYTTSNQLTPSASVDADGDFVVVWAGNGSSGTDSSDSVQGQRYASDGTPLGSEFQVNTFTTNIQNWPSVSVDADGDFVVVWISFGSSGSDFDNSSIQGQHYASDGTPLGSQFQVNTYTYSSQARPSASVDADGDFVVAWLSYGSSDSDSAGTSIQGQRYAISLFADGFESGDTSEWSSTVP